MRRLATMTSGMIPASLPAPSFAAALAPVCNQMPNVKPGSGRARVRDFDDVALAVPSTAARGCSFKPPPPPPLDDTQAEFAVQTQLVAALRGEVARLRAELEEQVRAAAAAQQALREQHSAELEALRRQKDNELALMRSEHDQGMRSEHDEGMHSEHDGGRRSAVSLDSAGGRASARLSARLSLESIGSDSEQLEIFAKESLENLRDVREKLAEIRMDAHEAWQQESQKIREEAERKAVLKASAAAPSPAASIRIVPAVKRKIAGFLPSTYAPDSEARVLSKALDLGKLITFKLKSKAIERAKNSTSVSSADSFEYTVLDLSDIGGRETTRPITLEKAFAEHKKKFTGDQRYDPEAWAAGIEELQSRQRAHYLHLLERLEERCHASPRACPPLRRHEWTPLRCQVEHRDEAAVAMLRLHSLPDEYTLPLKLGDIFVIWNPRCGCTGPARIAPSQNRDLDSLRSAVGETTRRLPRRARRSPARCPLLRNDLRRRAR